MSTAIEFNNVGKMYRLGRVGTGTLSHDLNRWCQMSVHGIIGKNGAGKSTLLKLLSNFTSPSTGSIKYQGRIASLLKVGTGFHPVMTGRENIYMNGSIMGMTKQELTRKLDEIVDFVGVERYLDTPVKRYSFGRSSCLLVLA